MTVLARARDWLIEPRPPEPPIPRAGESWAPDGWRAPAPDGGVNDAPATDAPAAAASPAADARTAVASPAVVAVPATRAAVAPAAVAPAAAGSATAAMSVAVLGRPGEAEPFAAALALALSAAAGLRTAAVIVVGAPGGEVAGAACSHAAKRLAARLDAHAIDACERGRLVWTLAEDGAEQVAAAQRVAGAVGPTVVAVTTPLTAPLQRLLASFDGAVVVTADPGGPLATLAADALGATPVLTSRPLARGVARTLAQLGLRAPRGIRTLVAETDRWRR